MAEHFLEIALLETGTKHEPMRVGMLDSAALAEDVRSLEMIEALGMLATPESCLRERNFYGVCGGSKLLHKLMIVNLEGFDCSPWGKVNFRPVRDPDGSNRKNATDMTKIVYVNQSEVAAREIYPGVRKRVLWQGANGAKAQILEIDPGASFLKLDVHHPGPEEVYVVSGTFNDGARDYPAGSFVHNPAGSSHLPQSRDGCVLFVFFPEG